MSEMAPGTPEWEQRRDAILLEDAMQPAQWWWLSFCDTTRPKGEQFLGVAIVQAGGIVSAVGEAHRLGCNPGGEVQGWPMPLVPAEEWRERLLSREEVEAMPPP